MMMSSDKSGYKPRFSGKRAMPARVGVQKSDNAFLGRIMHIKVKNPMQMHWPEGGIFLPRKWRV
jgi:hypothetical protein